MKKSKSLGDKITYAYIRRIKKWMFCPACQKGKMTINKKSTTWACEECGYKLSADEFEDDYVFWFCDECGSYLNNQEDFDRNNIKHICRNCGYENDTTFDNIKGICSDCGKTLPDPDATLCIDCKQIRKEKAKKWLITAGKVVGVVAAVAGAAYLASQSSNEDDTNYTPILDIENNNGDDIIKEFICTECGHVWSMAEDEDGLFNGYGLPPCPVCGGFSSASDDYADYTCEYCGHHWRQYGNGGLVLGCIPRCPKCRN